MRYTSHQSPKGMDVEDEASVTAKKLIAIKYEQKLAGSGWRDAFARSFPFGALKNNKTTKYRSSL